MFLQENKTYGMAELAEWFGITYGGFKATKTKEKKYEELKEFADYTREGNKVTITKVHYKEYIKDATVRLITKEFFIYWPVGENCSGSLAARRFMRAHPEIKLDIDTVAQKFRDVRTEKFAKPDGRSLGTDGYSRREWVKKVGAYEYEDLTPEEKKIMSAFRHKIFGDSSAVIPTFLLEMKEGKTHEEAWQTIEEEFDASAKGGMYFNLLRDNFGIVVNATRNTMCLGADRILFIQGLEEQNEREGQEFTRWMADMGYYADEVRD